MAAAESTLVAGQRLPNFLRPDASGRPVNFYQECCGRAIMLVVLEAAELATTKALIEALGNNQWALVVLVNTADPASAGPIDGADLVLADDGQVSAFLRQHQGPVTLLLDRQFRLLRRDELGVLTAHEAAAELSGLDSLSLQAPLLVVPRVLSAEQCGQLIAAYQADNEASGVLTLRAGQAVYEPQPDIKVRREHRLTQGHPLWNLIEHRLRCCLLPEISWAFNYQVTRFEGVKVVAYDAADGGYFSAHRDNDGEDTAHRRFAMTLNLNTPDYAGGALCFPEYGQCVSPDVGAATVFSCNLAHEAQPVTEGVRYALVSFFFSDAEQFQAVAMERRV